jgi:hypothetical protein
LPSGGSPTRTQARITYGSELPLTPHSSG